MFKIFSTKNDNWHKFNLISKPEVIGMQRTSAEYFPVLYRI